MNLPHSLERTVAICAAPETVFQFLTTTEHWAAWWGPGSTIDARPGGRAYIRYPNGVEVLGEILEVDAPRRIVFTYGYASGNPIPAGSSRVTIEVSAGADGGAQLRLQHDFAEADPCAMHVQGWRFQLSQFANVVANALFKDLDATADAWFAVWAEPDAARRRSELARLTTPEVEFRDRYSLLRGHDDIDSHIAASQRFMPGITMSRVGSARQCQGTALVEWSAANAAGDVAMAGCTVIELASDGRIRRATSVGK